MTLRITGSLASPNAVYEVINRYGRRSVAQVLYRQGKLAVDEAVRAANRELKRSTGRYADSMRAEYTGLDDLTSSGSMEIELRNGSKNAYRIEYGTEAHEIAPVNADRLVWPAERSRKGKPFRGAVGQSVWHPGQPGLHIMERSIALAVNEGIGSRTVGRVRMRFTSR